ncbi:hypothetical protein ACHAXT_009767 [Thalassiosira profunda]
MARGSDAKAARKQARKEARAAEAERILNGEDVNEFAGEPSHVIPDDSSSEEEEEVAQSGEEEAAETSEKKKKSKSARAKKKAAARTAARTRGGGPGDACCAPGGGGGSGEGIKTLPLVMLIMLTGTTVIPALLYMGDYFSAFLAKNHFMGNIGHRLGIGPSPKKRVISFYEKHDPEKLGEVSNILAKYYGDYPKLTKRLERKYGDYGYFINWEQDEAPMNLAFEKLWETHEELSKQFDRHAPAIVKTGARNMRHNFGFVYKKGHTLWKKTAARKQARKEARAAEAERILNGEDVNEFAGEPSHVIPDDSSSEEEEEVAQSGEEEAAETSEKKKKSKSARAKKKAAARTAARTRGGGPGDACCAPGGGGGSGEGIKTLPLVMLIMLTGTTVIPALLYMGDYFSAFLAKNHFMGNIGHRLGIGPSPKKRVISFYEKHDPEKLGEVSNILAKYYGDYPKLTKRLERKYGDYGYFINWEQDEAPMNLAFEKLWETHEELSKQFDRHAPAIVKTGARNMRHNFGFVYKKGHTLWKKTVWPVLKPYLATPDAKAIRQQKLKDKKEWEKRKKEQTGQRRKSAEFRDDDHDEM